MTLPIIFVFRVTKGDTNCDWRRKRQKDTRGQRQRWKRIDPSVENLEHLSH